MAENENKKVPAKGVHTYASDLADALSEARSEGSFVKKAIDEAREKEKDVKELSLQTRKNTSFVVGGIILIILALVAIGFVLQKPAKKIIPASFAPVIFTDRTEVIDVTDLSREKIIATIADKIRREVAQGQIDDFFLMLNGQRLDKNSFVGAVAPSAATDFASFIYDYQVGRFGGETNETYVLFTTNRPFDFKENLKIWEEKMLDDMQNLFDITYSKELFQTRMIDGFVSNRPARLIYFDDKIVFGYAFLDENTLAIAESLNAFEKLDQRLIQGKIK